MSINSTDAFEFQLLETGTNSELLLSGNPDDPARLVLKTVDVSHVRECNNLLNEYNMLQRLSHKNIVAPLSFRKELMVKGSLRSVLVLPFATHRSLLTVVKARRLEAAEVRELFGQVGRAVAYLHSNDLVHRDIKLQNVLVFEESGKLTAKLSDFGFAESCVNTDNTTRLFRSYKGTRRGYMAPEIHAVFEEGSNGYDGRKADIFALGVLLFSMLFRKLPFEFATKQNSIYRFISEEQQNRFIKHHDKEFSRREQEEPGMADDIKDLLLRMMDYTPGKRLSMEEVLAHPWMKGENKKVVTE